MLPLFQNPETTGCRFPLWPNHAQPTQQFCGAPRAPGKPYCATHHGLCYQPPAERITPVVWNYAPKRGAA